MEESKGGASEDVIEALKQHFNNNLYQAKNFSEVYATQRPGFRESISVAAILDEKYGAGNWARRGSGGMVLKNEHSLGAVTGKVKPYEISRDNLVIVDNIDDYLVVANTSELANSTTEDPPARNKDWSLSNFVAEVEEQFWATYDQDDLNTMPPKDDIINWLKFEHGLPAGKARSVEEVARDGRHNLGGRPEKTY